MIFVFNVSNYPKKISSIPDAFAVEQYNITFKLMHIPQGSQNNFYFSQFY